MDRRNFVKTAGWSVLGLAATGGVITCGSPKNDGVPAQVSRRLQRLRELRFWWGDLHNHCNVTYGHGDLTDALAAAREQLDFCSVTPHAMWPDIPSFTDKGMQWVIGYHLDAFKRLREGGYEKYVQTMREWNREEEYVHWQGNIQLSEGRILGVQPCFRGAAFTSPQPGESAFKTRVNRILSQSETAVELDLYSSKNPNTMTPATQGIVLDVEMPLDGAVSTHFNGQHFSHTLEELLSGSKAHFIRGWLSEAIQFNRAAPEEAFLAGTLFTDSTPERSSDYYYVRVRQRNGQWGFSSPIWVES